MAEYRWKPSQMKRVFVLPKDIVDRHLRLAGSVQLKVLLWVSRNGGEFDVDACAKAVGVCAPDCQDALQYWVAAGVLLPSNDEVTVSTPPPVDEQPKPVPAQPVVRPAAVKPQMTEVVKKQKKCPDFAYLLEAVSARLGRPLANGDAETMLYLYETAGLPAEVILMVVGYAAQTNRFNMRYIEKVALDWADKGIMTMAAAEEHLCLLERCQDAIKKVQTVCGLTRPLSGEFAERTAEKWIYQWKVEDALLLEAYNICVEKTGGFQTKYVDKVLENWRMQEITTPEQLQSGGKNKKKAPSSEENQEYETMVENYIPVYKKKGKR
ncbi:MAG: DnaD domain protein [Clostridia bacterium]|nr:DnaD domain protein [Clostridia bacterium]